MNTPVEASTPLRALEWALQRTDFWDSSDIVDVAEVIVYLRKRGFDVVSGWQPVDDKAKSGDLFEIARHMGSPWGWVRGVGYYASIKGVEGWITQGFCEPPGNLGLGGPTHYRPLSPPPTAPEGNVIEQCSRCDGGGWLEPIGPCVDGSYVTSRPCPECNVVSVGTET